MQYSVPPVETSYSSFQRPCKLQQVPVSAFWQAIAVISNLATSSGSIKYALYLH